MSLAAAMRLSPEDSLRTFSEDENLPSLPLPSLSHTLNRYLDSVRPFVSQSEFLKTEEIVKRFESGQGKMLHEKLKMKAEISRNWVEKWWEDKAYLENRMPLLPFCSMIGVSPLDKIWQFKPGQMVKYASMYMYYTIEMWCLLRSELLVPTQSTDGKTMFSMDQFRRLFNCCRVPLPGRDRLDIHFKTEREGSCPFHVLVACNGHLFCVDAIDEATRTPLNPPEWEKQLQFIVDNAMETKGPGISQLSCDDRDTWTKNYEHLKLVSGENARNIHLIESAICMLILDPNVEPNSLTEVASNCLVGNYTDVWADKSVHIMFYGNGRSGGLAEHTAFDGLISITSSYYTFQSLMETNGEWVKPTTIRSLSPPCKLNFVLDVFLREELKSANMRQSISRTKVIVIREEFCDFGKSFTVKNRVHPDTFVQMALQLTYYRMHRRLAPCYETATTRAFYRGRTETMRPCTTELSQWIHAMLDGKTKNNQKEKLLRVAAQRHDDLMKQAREAMGCDRHLFGLYCIAEENGLPIPDLFTDASYSKSGGGGNFVLSTSLVGYSPVGGGVGPMVLDGYGIFYNICPTSVYFNISVMRDSSETSASKFFCHLCETLNEMKSVIERVHHKAHDQMSSTHKAHL